MVANRATARGQGRSALIAAALRLIARRGMHGFVMRELADEARVSLGSVTYHFVTREGVMSAALSDHVGRYRASIAAALAPGTARTPQDSNAALRQALTDLFADRTTVLVTAEIVVNAARDPAVREIAVDIDRMTRDLLKVVHRNLGRAVTEAAVRGVADTITSHAARTAQRHATDRAFQTAMRRYLHSSFPR